ncbi:MAG: hypothetical protein KA020_18020 [Planctomycetes bacterium]|nr:hypothetical protein [Planctomycetota bacterium]MCC7061364.1 hypothetical protein [Planctomycetota bacterium]
MFSPGILRLVSLVLLAGCAATPPIHPHRHRSTATVTLTNTAVLPTPHVSIPAFATIVWRNGGTTPIQIEVQKAVCNECDTVLGFLPDPLGARSVVLAPQGVATLCFHDEGEFAFVARGAGTEQRGVIHVGAHP